MIFYQHGLFLFFCKKQYKNSRLVEGDHNIDCRIDGFGAMQLKSEFVKKL